MSSTEKIIVGRVGAPYGVRGWVKINSFTSPPDNLANYDPWFIEIDGAWREVKLTSVKAHGDGLIALIPGYNDRDEAQSITHATIAIEHSQLPKLKKNQFYWRDLIGLTVIDQQKKVMGVVSNLLETGANDVLLVKGETEFAVPFLLDTVVLKVDLKEKQITVDWDPI